MLLLLLLLVTLLMLLLRGRWDEKEDAEMREEEKGWPGEGAVGCDCRWRDETTSEEREGGAGGGE